MNTKNTPLTLRLFSVVLSLVTLPSWSTQAQTKLALVHLGQTLPSSSSVQVTFEPPDNGRPNNTVGGASRDGGLCPQDPLVSGPSLTPLIPTTKYGLTVAQRPTFFVYVPQTSAQKVFFSLEDEKKNHHYQITFSITGNPGVVSFQLPANAPTLKVGQSYKWSFVILCGNVLRPDSPGIEGWIRRVELNPVLRSRLEKSNSLERAAFYGKDGIWYDTLTALAEAWRSPTPDSTVVANWEQLLKSVGLEAIATQPLVKEGSKTKTGGR